MDRHLPDDQLDRALLGFFTDRQDELLATAPTAHLVAVRIAATVSPTAARRRRPALALLVALLVTLLAAAAIVVGSGLLQPSPISVACAAILCPVFATGRWRSRAHRDDPAGRSGADRRGRFRRSQ